MAEDDLTPIFVLGAGHSGTGILYRMLALHPDLAWFSQFSQRDGRIDGRRALPFAFLLDSNLRRLARHDWHKKHTGWRQKVLPRPKEGHGIWAFIFPKNGEPVSDAAARVRDLLDEETKLWKKQHFIAKLPRLYAYIDVLHEAFPNACFVHIVRDGRAVALSNRYKKRKTMRTETEAQRTLARTAAFWKDVVTTVDVHRSQIRLLEIRYEDLCDDVHEHVARIFGFCGLETDRFPFDSIPTTLSVTNQRWLDRATEPELRYLEDELGPLLENYGYLRSTTRG